MRVPVFMMQIHGKTIACQDDVTDHLTFFDTLWERENGQRAVMIINFRLNTITLMDLPSHLGVLFVSRRTSFPSLSLTK